MHKFKLVVAVMALCGVLGTGTVAKAEVVQAFEVKVSSTKPSESKKKQRGVALEVATATGTSDGSSPPELRNVKISFPKGWIFNASAFSTCDLNLLRAQKLEKCNKARVGSGSAEIKAFSELNAAIPPIVAQAKVTAYNGTPEGGKSRVLLYATTTTPVSTRTILVGTLSGRSLNLPIQLTNPIPSSKLVITKFRVKIDKVKAKASKGKSARKASKKGKKNNRSRKKGKSKSASTKYYMAAPQNCSGKWPFASTFQFADGQVKQVTAQIKCDSAKKSSKKAGKKGKKGKKGKAVRKAGKESR